MRPPSEIRIVPRPRGSQPARGQGSLRQVPFVPVEWPDLSPWHRGAGSSCWHLLYNRVPCSPRLGLCHPQPAGDEMRFGSSVAVFLCFLSFRAVFCPTGPAADTPLPALGPTVTAPSSQRRDSVTPTRGRGVLSCARWLSPCLLEAPGCCRDSRYGFCLLIEEGGGMGDSSQSSGVFSVGFRAGFWRRKRIECWCNYFFFFFFLKTQYFHHEKK